MVASVARPRLVRSEDIERRRIQPIGYRGAGRCAEMLVAMDSLPPAHLQVERSTRLAAGCLLLALSVAGIAGFARYVHDYLLYRGFGPPVATVSPGEQGRITALAFRSRSLGGRLEHALVYLPAAYRSQPQRRFPVVYLLHGTPGD